MFASLFDLAELSAAFTALGHASVVVHGEAYGGSQQKQAWRYGPALRFVAFDVRIGDTWLVIPDAYDVAGKLGLDFVHFERVPTDLAVLDQHRDAPSEQARRNGVDDTHPREGVILRPLIEVVDSLGERICAKHKRDEERETATPRRVVDPTQMEVLADAERVAMEWVTDTRLDHVLDKISGDRDMRLTSKVIDAMVSDVMREGAGEIVDSREVRRAISSRARQLYHARVKEGLR